jgi:hypothetical protein
MPLTIAAGPCGGNHRKISYRVEIRRLLTAGDRDGRLADEVVAG